MNLKNPRSFALSFALCMAASPLWAQTTPAPASTPDTAATSPAKKELVARLLKLQGPGIERLSTAMIEEPAVVIGGRASEVIALRVPKDRQEAVAKEVQGEMQKYLKDAGPLVRKSALQLAPATIGPMLENNFSEDELRHIVALLESPAYAKYQMHSREMQQALQERLVTQTRASVEQRVQALEKAIGERLKTATAGASTQPATPAKPGAAAAKPAGK